MRVGAAIAALVAGLCLFLGVGHGLHGSVAAPHETMESERGGGDVAGVCLVLFTIALPVLLAVPALGRRSVGRPTGPAGPTGRARASIRTIPAGARASPVWLQRFRN